MNDLSISEILIGISKNPRPFVYGAIWGMLLLSNYLSLVKWIPSQNYNLPFVDRAFLRIEKYTKEWKYASLRIFPGYVFFFVWFLLLAPLRVFLFALLYYLLFVVFVGVVTQINCFMLLLLGKVKVFNGMLIMMGIFVDEFKLSYEPVALFTIGEAIIIGLFIIFRRVWNFFFIQPAIGLVKGYANLPDRTIAIDYVDDRMVATVFFGDRKHILGNMDYFGNRDYSSIAFVTLVYGPEVEVDVRAYPTLSEAKEGHKQVIKELRGEIE